MGGGRSGLYHKTTGAKSTGLPLMGGTFAISTFTPQNGTGFVSFNGIENNGRCSTNTGYSQSKHIVEIVAAIIWREDKFLICQRPVPNARALLWEFVSDKVEEHETKEQALIRECREKLAISVVPKKLFMEFTHEYSDIIVHLSVFSCTISEGEPQFLKYNDIKWITARDIENYDFCTTDKQILEKIKSLKRSI